VNDMGYKDVIGQFVFSSRIDTDGNILPENFVVVCPCCQKNKSGSTKYRQKSFILKKTRWVSIPTTDLIYCSIECLKKSEPKKVEEYVNNLQKHRADVMSFVAQEVFKWKM
jgi:phage-related protein